MRVRDFGPVSLNGSFIASCPLALSSALFVSQQARPLTKTRTGSELTRIEHLGSFACRNIYSRPDARRSEHATADALDISAFRLANGQRVTVLNGWKAERRSHGYRRCCRQVAAITVTVWGRTTMPPMPTISIWECAAMAYVDEA